MNEEQSDNKISISVNDLPGLVSTINQCSENIESNPKDILKILKHLFLGMSSHNINKRKGYVLVVNVLLKKYRSQISEENAIQFCESLKFGRDKQKTAIRTSTIAKILSYISFIKSEIITSDDGIINIMTEINGIANTKPNLAPFSLTVLAEIQSITKFKYLSKLMEIMRPCLDTFICIFKVSQVCPPEFRQFLPKSFQSSTFNEATAKHLCGTALATKQPWNSDIWKVIANETPEEDLLTFWPQVVGKLIRSTEPTFQQNVAALHIVESVLPTLRPNVYNIVISSTFIRMINSLITKPQLQPQVDEFLTFVVNLCDKNRKIVPNIVDAFAHVDFRQPGGFDFHLNLFNKCEEGKLAEIFEKIQNFTENNLLEFKQRFSSQKVSDISVSKFKLDTLRAVFVSSSRFPNPEFTLNVFNYILDNWKDYLSILISDIVKYDTNRVEGSASLSDLAHDPSISNFAACYKLYSICTGVSSSPSLNTLIAPEIDDTQPTADLILMATQRASDSILIVHAFKTYLKRIVPLIPPKDIEQLFADYVPLTESFSIATIDIFQIVLANMKSISYSIVAPIFSLFCKIITNVGGTSVQPACDLVKAALNLLSKSPPMSFQFPSVLNSIFESFTCLSHQVLKQNQKAINKTFEAAVTSVIKAVVPLSSGCKKCLVKNLDAAICDFAFKSTQHFDESFFSAFLRLPNDVTSNLFPIVMKHLPEVKRIQRRIQLIDLVTSILSQPKGSDTLAKYENDFNGCVLTLLNESFTSKDDEKKFTKFIIALNKWFSLLDCKREASGKINIGDIKRKMNSILNTAHEPLLTTIKQCLQTISKIETQVHPKQRAYS